MRKRGVVASAVVAMGLVAVIGPGLLPTGEDDYGTTAASGARDAGSAVRTAQLLTRATLDGQVMASYRVAVFDDARERASDAVRRLLDLEVPGETSARLRDRAAPLLTEAVGAITDAARAAEDGDRDRLTAVLGRLDRVAAGLGEVAAA